MVWRAAPGRVAVKVVCALAQSIVPLAGVYCLKRMIDAVVAGGGGVMVWLAAMAAAFLVARVAGAADRVNGDVLAQRLTDYMSDLVQRQASRLDLAYYDTPSYHDTLHRAQLEAATRPLAVLGSFIAVGGSLAAMAVIVAMLAEASWWVAPVLVVAVVPSLVVRLCKAREVYRFRRGHTQLYRRTAYYSRLLTSREAAAEMRSSRLAPHFRRLFVEARARLVSDLLRISRRMGVADVLCGIVEAEAMLLVLGLLAGQAVAGAIGVGTLVMLAEAMRRGQGQMASLVGGLAGLYDNRLFAGNLVEFLDMEPTITDPDSPLDPPAVVESLELRDVTFRYPGMERDVLSHFSLKAVRGELCRIDGENGRGKSTVVKLLLRLYDPQEGQVLLNGIDVRRFSLDGLRRTMGVLFQNFVCYQATLAENIAVGDIDRPGRGVGRAASLSGADRVAAGLPQGEGTMLGRMFDGGQELSMGQWQRVALARALQSDAQVLLLDEPAAWLDATARADFLAALEKLKKDKIIVLITHT